MKCSCRRETALPVQLVQTDWKHVAVSRDAEPQYELQTEDSSLHARSSVVKAVILLFGIYMQIQCAGP